MKHCNIACNRMYFNLKLLICSIDSSLWTVVFLIGKKRFFAHVGVSGKLRANTFGFVCEILLN